MYRPWWAFQYGTDSCVAVEPYNVVVVLMMSVFGGYEDETDADRDSARDAATAGRKKQNPNVSPPSPADGEVSLNFAQQQPSSGGFW